MPWWWRLASPTVCSTADGLGDFTGRGVFYGAAANDAASAKGDDVYIVGAANSAGQAALHIAQYANRVVMLVRGDSLATSMSHYLVDRVESTDNIDVRPHTEVVRGGGTDHLEWLTLVDRDDRRRGDGRRRTGCTRSSARCHEPTGSVTAIARDERGFVLTGPDVAALDGDGRGWPLARPPFLLETSVPGVFAAGDVRRDIDEAGGVGRGRGLERGQQYPPVPGDGMSVADDLRGACA